ncbi:MAG: DUF5123 domain-containing protein [Sulfitobacter sp.]|nr:DUF5123 domain-containing protein [Sulfitobacter sp.]
MVLPTITYDATNGSDTASGGGVGRDSGSTGYTGTDGDGTGTTLTLNETKNFTAGDVAVAEDGSDVLWYDGVAGERHLFSISSFNPSAEACTSITTVESFDSAQTAQDWAVGGERKTLEGLANPDHEDWGAGWTIEFDAGTYTVTDTLTPLGGTRALGPTTLQASSGAATRPILDVTSNIVTIHTAGLGTGESIVIKGLEFNSTAASNATLWLTGMTDCDIYAHDCEFDVADVGVMLDAAATGNTLQVRDCVFASSTDSCIEASANTADWQVQLLDCLFKPSSASATLVAQGTACQWSFINCVFNDKTGNHIYADTSTASFGLIFIGNTFYGAGTTAIDLSSASQGNGFQVLILNNIFYGCGTALDSGDSTFTAKLHVGPNAYGGNDTDLTNVTAHADDVALTADPFTDAANDDFTLNNVAGGGALLRHTAEEVA